MHQAGERDVAGVEALHQLRHQRNQEQLRQAGPGQHRADLLGIVALRLAEIGRQDDRPMPNSAKPSRSPRKWCRSRNCAASAAASRISGFSTISSIADEQRQADGGDDGEPQDEGRAEPVVLVAFLEHGLQRRQVRPPW